MKVTCVMVMSLDGRITLGDVPGTGAWHSAEDQAFFTDMVAAATCLVMGAETYRVARANMRPDADKLRIVLTRDPAQFADDSKLPGLLFTAAEPGEVLKQAADAGHDEVLLVGGAQTNARFFDANLVNELFVTVEPQLFGSGKSLVGMLAGPKKLHLLETRQLNDNGTMLLHYEILGE